MHPINEAREWLLSGGGGYEGGEDGIKAMTVTGASLVDFLAAYAKHFKRQKRRLESKMSEFKKITVFKIEKANNGQWVADITIDGGELELKWLTDDEYALIVGAMRLARNDVRRNINEALAYESPFR